MTAARQHPTTPLAHVDAVVLDYLAALWAAAEDLPPELRDDLMSTVADYIAMRRGARVDPLDDAEQIVLRLGPPADLVAAAGRGRLPAHLRAPHVQPEPARPAGHGDHAAVVLLVAGAAVLPAISSLAGLLLVSGSARWTSAQKAAAWVLTAGGGLLGLACLILLGLSGIGEAGLVMAYLSLLTGSAVAGLTLVPGLINRRV